MFFKKLEKLCFDKGITITELVLSLGLSSSNATYWKTGSVPRRKTLEKVANYFNVSVDYLVSDEPTSNKLNIVMEELAPYATDNKQFPIDMEAIKKLSKESQDELFDLIKKTVKRMRDEEEKQKAIEMIKSLPAEDRKAIKDML